jgi:hypothetical protein
MAPDRTAARAALADELGLRAARTDVPVELIPTRLASSAASMTGAPAATGDATGTWTLRGVTRPRAHAPASAVDPAAALLRVDGDGRIALGALGDAADWLSSSQPGTVFTDRASRRIWGTATDKRRSDSEDSCAMSHAIE